MNAIAAKLERYRNPWQELRLQYGANKGKAYTGAAGCQARCQSCSQQCSVLCISFRNESVHHFIM